MGYIDESLLPGEKVVYLAKAGWSALILPVSFSILILAVSFKMAVYAGVIILIFILYALLRVVLTLASVEFALTNARLIAKRGILKQHSLELMLQKVESVAVTQSLDGRIFNFGSVTVIGTGGTHETFKPISNPMELRKRINYMVGRINQLQQQSNQAQRTTN
jgi:uncharacterized membrane protein YdbT with pleckstrin-like domain